MNKKLLLLIPGFFFASIYILSAQYSLSGIVGTDSKDIPLLEDVEISIPELNRFDISKDGGTYIFRNIAKGIVHVEFKKEGYRTLLKLVEIKDSATVVHVTMSPTRAEAEMSAPLNTNQVLPAVSNFAIRTFSTEELKDRGSINLTTALSCEPGFDVRSSGYAFSQPVIRGFSSQRIQVRQFGTRIENQSWKDYNSTGVNDNGTSKLILVKGPASLLYGAGASGGVLIYQEELPPVAGTVEGELAGTYYSNTAGINGEAGIKGMSKSGFFYGLRLGAESHSSYVQGEGGEQRKNTEDLAYAVNSKLKNQNMKAYAGMSKSWGTSRLSFSYLNEEAGIIGTDDSVYADVLRFNEIQRSKSIDDPSASLSSIIIASENTILTGKSKIQLNLSHQMNDDEDISAEENGILKNNKIRLNSTELSLNYRSNADKKLVYTAGLQGILQSNTNSGTEALVPDAKVNNIGAFVLLNYSTGKFNFSAGARYDMRHLELSRYMEAADSYDTRKNSVKLDYNPPAFSLGLNYTASEKFSCRLIASSANVIPDYRQLYAYGVPEDGNRFEVGNDSLNYELNSGLNAGLTWAANDVSINADFYFNQLSDYTHLVNTGGFRVNPAPGDSLIPVYYYVQENGSMYGAELSLSIHPQVLHWIMLNASYSMQRGTFDKEGDLGYIPADKAGLSLQFHTEKMNYLYQPFIRIVLNNYFKQDLISMTEESSESYSLINLQAGGKLKWGKRYLSISLSANNLLNERYTSHLSGLKHLGVSDMGRNVAIHFSMPFGIMKNK